MRYSPAEERLSNEIFDVVRSAIWNGVSAQRFKEITAEAWTTVLQNEVKNATKVFQS